MTDAAYLRFPHVRNDLLTFVAEDDVWLAPLGGGRAWRLTADQETASNPRISPDGTRVAWTSTREGAPEVHVAPVDGGTARRLTHWGDIRTRVLGWLDDDRVLALSTAGQGSRRRTWAWAVPLDGGAAERLPYGITGGLALGPDGAALLLSVPMGREPAWWKRYRGGTAGKLWIDRTGGGEFERVHAELDGNIDSPLWVGDRIAFLSDHEGIGQLYSSLPDGSDLRRHTSGEWYARNASTDGTRVVWHSAGDLLALDSLDADAEPYRPGIALGGPRSARAPKRIDAAKWLGDFTADRTGRASAVEVRGTVHWLTHRDGPVRALADAPGVRGRLPVVLGDTGKAAWVTDADGEDAIEIAPAEGRGSAEPRRLAAGRLGRVLALAASPDGSRLAAAAHDGRLLVLDAESGDLRELATSEWGDIDGLAFSPDSRWLAFAQPGIDHLQQIRLADLVDGGVLDATPLRFQDFSPTFTADGKHLAFLSYRTFDPVYDSHAFDLSFPGGCRPQLLALAADTPSPFAPQRDGRGFGDERPGDGAKGGENGAKKDEPPAPPETVVDAEGLDQRVVPFPVPAGQYDGLTAAKGGVLWRRRPITGNLGTDLAEPGKDAPRPALERFDLAKREVEQLYEGVSGFAVSGDGTRVVIADRGRLVVRPSDRKVTGNGNGGGGDDDITVDLSRIRVTVDPGAEWRQAFDENGRLMRDHFWRPDLGGVDWNAVLDRYRPLVERVGSRDEFCDLLWETVGELGTSHAYVMPAGAGKPRRVRQGLLGADWDVDADGRWRIARVLPGEPSDPYARSPLTAPGVGVRAGDAVTAVDGRPVDPVTGPGPLLVGTAGKPVELTVDPASGGEQRHVVVVPLADEQPLRYQAWVNERRAYVHEKSGGRLGYLHVPDMQAVGWAQLHRDLRTETACEGLVVDIRENGGGHTSQLVLEKISKQVIGYDVARHMGWETYPANAPRGPVVVVTNEHAGSDGDIISAAVQSTGLGPVIGTRTWGGVVGIDGRYELVDGTGVTQPRYAFWFAKHGWGVENYGVDPDIEVVMAPQDWVAGRDPQLDRGIAEAVARLAERPASVPPGLPSPNRGARITG